MIRTSGLVKRYGKIVALDGLDLEVPKGSVFGLLGPNGAGKTTAIRILTTLLEPDEGTAEVAGLDVQTHGQEVRERIGLSGQTAAVDEHLTGFENLDMVGRLYHLGRARSRARARELLERVELDEAADRPAKTYSGGMRRRLDLALALVHRPQVLFLDEPTTGLDPLSRLTLWDEVRRLNREGTTVFLTSQYLEEVDQLAGRLGIIDGGRIVADGTPAELKAQVGDPTLTVTLADPADGEAAQAALGRFGRPVDAAPGRVAARLPGGAEALADVVRALDTEELEVEHLQLHQPTLDDVFLAKTGRSLEGAGEEEPADRSRMEAVPA
jgi:ABC-2 type transport system ATP-binding protein